MIRDPIRDPIHNPNEYDPGFVEAAQAWRINCPFKCPIILSIYKHDACPFLWVLKSGWWWPFTFENVVIILIRSAIERAISEDHHEAGVRMKRNIAWL